MIGQWLGSYAGHWFGRVVAVVVTPSGGWYYPGWWRRKKRDEEDLADAIEAHLVHTGVIEPDTAPLKIKAFMAKSDPEHVPAHVREAIKRAVRSETKAAFDLALKRIREMEEEEEFAVLFIALH